MQIKAGFAFRSHLPARNLSVDFCVRDNPFHEKKLWSLTVCRGIHMQLASLEILAGMHRPVWILIRLVATCMQDNSVQPIDTKVLNQWKLRLTPAPSPPPSSCAPLPSSSREKKETKDANELLTDDLARPDLGRLGT